MPTCISFTGEECLVVLGGEVHVVVGEWLLLGGLLEPLVLGAAEQVEGVPPHLALRHRGRAGRGLRGVAATQPRRDMVQRHLLDE